MKIIFLDTVQNFGGATKSTIELATRLSEQHEILIIDFYGTCQPFISYLNEQKVALVIVDERQKPFIIKSSRNRFKNYFNLLIFLPHWLRLRLRIRSILQNFKADYIIVSNAKSLSVLSFSNNRGYKVLYYARTWFNSLQISKANKLLYKILVDRFICVSEATRQAAYCAGLARLDELFVVHNAINESDLSKKVVDFELTTADYITILHSAGFLAEKGQHISLEVARILRERGVKLKLVLAGIVYDGPTSKKYYKEIIRKISLYNLDDVVVIVKNKSDVMPLFRACDVLIHPSASEGLPRVIMEAMILKKPVIANAVGGVTDYVLDGFTGLIANYNDPYDYARCIEQLQQDYEKKEFIVNNAYSLIKKSFNESSQLDAFNKLFLG